MTEAFTKQWLATDTSFKGMSAEQYIRLRKMCNCFFEAGRKIQKPIQKEERNAKPEQ